MGYSGECYGSSVKTRLIEYLREEKRFSSPQELADAIAQNAEYVKNHSKVKI